MESLDTQAPSWFPIEDHDQPSSRSEAIEDCRREKGDWGWFIAEEEMEEEEEEAVNSFEEAENLTGPQVQVPTVNADQEPKKETNQLPEGSLEHPVEVASSCVSQEEVYDFEEILAQAESNRLNEPKISELRPSEVEAINFSSCLSDSKLESTAYRKERESMRTSSYAGLLSTIGRKSIVGLNLLAQKVGKGFESLSKKVPSDYVLYPVIATFVNILLIDRRNESVITNRVGC